MRACVRVRVLGCEWEAPLSTIHFGLHALLLAPEQQVGHPRTGVSLSGHAAIVPERVMLACVGIVDAIPVWIPGSLMMCRDENVRPLPLEPVGRPRAGASQR